MSNALTVEDILDRCSALPLEVRRSMELCHVLDTRWIATMTAVREAHNSYLKALRTRVEKHPKDGSVDVRKLTEDADALAHIEALRLECAQVSAQKVSVAQQAYDTIKTASDKLAADLRRFEGELRVSGELVDERDVRVGVREEVL